MSDPMTPTKEEFAKFVRTFDLLSSYEAQQRIIRGHGLFKPEDLPIPEVVTVLNWLRRKAHGEIRALASE